MRVPTGALSSCSGSVQRCHTARLSVHWAQCRRMRTVAKYQRDPPTESQDAKILMNLTQDIAEHCSTLAPGDRAECAQVQAWFREKCLDTLDKSEPHSHPEPSAGPGSPSVEDEARTLRMRFRELAFSGSIKEIYQALLAMKHLEDKRAAGHIPSVRIPSLSLDLPVTSDPEGRALLITLFQKADFDGDGRLTWQEFNNALHFINDDLDEEELELVSSALDLQGSVTLDQFLAIVEQAEVNKSIDQSDAPFLRHLTHHHPADIDHVTRLNSD